MEIENILQFYHRLYGVATVILIHGDGSGAICDGSPVNFPYAQLDQLEVFHDLDELRVKMSEHWNSD